VLKTKSNSKGYGGQLNYFGLWIDGNFETGHSKAKPLSTTYNSPCLSGKESFKIKNIEVWCVLEPEPDPNAEDGSDVFLFLSPSFLFSFPSTSGVALFLKKKTKQ